MSVEFSKGLEGVIADQTSISNVEGDTGRLSYRGYVIEDLVTLNFTQVMWLVLFGELATAEQQALLSSFLKANGALSDSEIDILRALATTLTAASGRLLSLEDVQTAFVERSRGLITADFVAAYVGTGLAA